MIFFCKVFCKNGKRLGCLCCDERDLSEKCDGGRSLIFRKCQIFLYGRVFFRNREHKTLQRQDLIVNTFGEHFGRRMVTAMVDTVLSVSPASMARFTHILYAIIILPLEIFIPYQAFQSMYPLLLGIGAGCGLTAYQVLTCMNISYLNPCSPLVTAANLACELAEVDIIKQVKFSAIFCLAFNTIGVLLCVLLGLT